MLNAQTIPHCDVTWSHKSRSKINNLYLLTRPIPGARDLSRYVTSRLGQLNLAIPSWIGARAITLCDWGVKADMVRMWVAGKTV